VIRVTSGFRVRGGSTTDGENQADGFGEGPLNSKSPLYQDRATWDFEVRKVLPVDFDKIDG
jgi:hypothetical protein